MTELDLIADADARAGVYLASVGSRRVFPDAEGLAALAAFDEALPERGHDAAATLRLLDDIGSPATAVSNGPRYFGFVIGEALPAAAGEQHFVQRESYLRRKPQAASIAPSAGATDRRRPIAARMERIVSNDGLPPSPRAL